MSNYSKTTDFAAKDSLPSGDSGKIIRGSEFETEFDAISTAIATKADAADPTFTGTVTIDGLTVNGNTVLGNAATDTVTVTADIASNLIPSADDTYNLGASGAEWNDLYVDGVAYIDTIDGFATTGNVTFGDNDKAIFGASSDLQIYHDGSDSFIVDQGTGNLAIRASSSLYLQSAAGSTYFQGVTGGAATLYNAGAAKLATTSTGVDVTGTVTADGLTVDGSGTVNGSLSLSDTNISIDLMESDAADVNTRLRQSGGDFFLQTLNDAKSAATSRINVDHNTGDISFYEDTGTTAKLFWDASAESLGIGTTSITAGRTLETKGGRVRFDNTADAYHIDLAVNGNTYAYIGSDTDNHLVFYNGSGTERVRIDSSGRVGIGTTSPATSLHVLNTSDTQIRLSQSGEGSYDLGVIDGDKFAINRDGLTNEFVMSNGNVGIGTSSPAATTDIRGANVAVHSRGQLYLANTETAAINQGSQISLGGTYSATSETFFGSIAGRKENATSGNFAGYLQFATRAAGGNNVEAMRIDSNGNVGIGTTSPGSYQGSFNDLVVAGSANSGITIASGTTSEGTLAFADGVSGAGTDAYRGYIQYEHNGDDLRFGVAGSERMRIDSSGNLLVGTTTLAPATAGNTSGAHIYPSGQGQFSQVSAASGVFNRKTTDGTILDFRKDGSTVGSIGSSSSGGMFIGSGDTGLNFRGDLDSIYAWNPGGGARANAVDLGYFTVPFKDLYLSGGVYLGGTAAANKLDDYEEGTFTPVVADAASGGNTATVGTTTGTYVKIGNLVYVTINLVNITTTGLTGSNTLHVRSLPFTSASEFNTTSYGTAFLDSVNVDDSSIGIVSQVLTNTTVLKFRVSRDATTDIDLTVSTLTSGNADISTTICYQVA